jgi:hypothetical protein
VRIVRIKKLHDHYSPEKQVGMAYTLVVYYPDGVDVTSIKEDVKPAGIQFERGHPSGSSYKSESELRAVIIRIHEIIGTTDEVTVTLTPKNVA